MPRPFELDSAFFDGSTIRLNKRKEKHVREASHFYLRPGKKVTMFLHVPDYPVSWYPPKTQKKTKGSYTLIIRFFMDWGRDKDAFYHELKIRVHLK